MPNIIRFQSSYQEPYPLQVQGESYYRKNIEDITNYMGEEEGVNADDFIAQLILDDKNIYDPGNAVRVEIEGKIVGHLSKTAAKKYRQRLAQLALSDVIGECYASIRGGFITREGSQADFGVRLDLNLDDFEVLKPKTETLMRSTEPEPANSEPVIRDSMEREKSQPQKIRDWFFAPSEYRALRIILFCFLALSLSFCVCVACGTILRFIPGNT